jgi:hypothetical protein
MSGPLASWALEHAPKGLGARRRAILMKLALRANHDGSDADVSVQSIVNDLEVSPRTARADLAELEKRGVVELVERGHAGAGHVTRRRVVVQWCEEACRLCDSLAEQQQRSRKGPQGTVSPSSEPTHEKGPSRDRFSPAPAKEKGPSEPKKGPSAQEKGPQGTPPRTTEDGSPLKGEPSGHPVADDRAPLRSAASGSAARSSPGNQSGGGGAGEPGDPASNGTPLPASKPASNRSGGCPEHLRSALYEAVGVKAPPRDQTHPRDWVAETRQRWEAWRVANPQPPLLPTPGGLQVEPPRPGDPEPVEDTAGSEPATPAPELTPAAAGSVDRSPVIPVVDPADVTYPSDDLGAVAGPCVICQQACTSLHRVSAQVRHATCRDPVAKPAA